MGKHVSVFYGVIHKEKNRLEFANAGQFPYPLLFSASGGTQILEQRTPPLGLFPNARYQRASLDLPETFHLVICSDGVLDVLPQVGLADKLATIERTAEACVTPDALAETLQLASRESLPDDITILTISRGKENG